MLNEIGLRRLNSQHISEKKLTTPKEIVSWMGAIQAQDLNSAKWALGVRLVNFTEQQIDDSIGKGEIIRTHLMRPTWHMIVVEDYLPILKLTEPNIRATLIYRRKQLELDEQFFKKSNAELEKILSGGNGHTREEITRALENVFPSLDGPRMNHILLEAELDGLICSGRIKNRQNTYVLTEQWIAKNLLKSNFYREEALALLAFKYFRSHGPAMISDFNWWSGLSMSDCRKAMEMVKDKLISEKVDSQTFWFDGNSEIESTQKKNKRLFILPAFDEFIISYRDRSAVLAYEHHQMTVSSNGIFRPVIVLDGQVIGLWNKTVKKNTVIPEVNWFIKPEKKILNMLVEAFEEYSQFLSRTLKQ